MHELSDQQEAFLREGHIAVVTTLRGDGSPHSTVVWIDWSRRRGAASTRPAGRAKERHLLADPRVAVTVVDSGDFHRWLTVEGRAILVDEGADEHIDALGVRYMGPAAERISGRGEQRVIVRVSADRIEHEGLGARSSIKMIVRRWRAWIVLRSGVCARSSRRPQTSGDPDPAHDRSVVRSWLGERAPGLRRDAGWLLNRRPACPASQPTPPLAPHTPASRR